MQEGFYLGTNLSRNPALGQEPFPLAQGKVRQLLEQLAHNVIHGAPETGKYYSAIT
jgi:hypothetical protein